MASDYRILALGTTYYLHNSNAGIPTPGGSATAANTTPYVIVDDYLLNVAQRQMLYAKDSPTRVGFGNVTETWKILVSGSSHDSMMNFVRLLRLILNTALYTVPAIFQIDPNNGTNPVYYEIYSADVQETNEQHMLIAEGGTAVICTVTWTRSAFGGRLTTPEDVLSAANYRSRFSGTPDADSTFTGVTGGGDLTYNGSPLNISIDNTTSGVTLTNWLLSVGRGYNVVSTTQTVTTSSTTGATAAVADNNQLSFNTIINSYQALKVRLLAQTTTATTGSQFRVLVSTLAPNLYATFPTAGEQIVYTSPWFTSANNAQLVDCGTIPIDFVRDTLIQGVYVLLQVRSPAGTSVTVTVSNWVTLYYWTICRSTPALVVPFSPSGRLHLDTFIRPVSGGPSDRPNLPMARPGMYVMADTDTIQIANSPIIGTPPKYFYLGSLFVIPQISYPPNTSVAFATTHTYDVTATHAPLFHSYRGNG